jgi:hypothetical protein
MNLVIFCHDENSPFAQPEECLSVANSLVSRKWKSIAAPAFKAGFHDRRTVRLSKTKTDPTHWTQIPRLKL